MNWHNTAREIQQDSRHRSQLRAAIAVSLVLHGMVLAVTLWMADQRTVSRQALNPVTVRINLLPPAQQPGLQPEAPVPAPPEQTVQAVSEPQPPSEVAEAATSDPVERPAESIMPEPLVELPQLADRAIAPQDGDAESGPAAVPETLTVRQTVRAMRENQRIDAALSNCTPVQRRNELIECLDDEVPDYAVRLRNPVYLSFNQAETETQSPRAMGTIADNQQQLRSGVERVSLNGVNNDYLLEELSQGIEVYSATGNTRLERLTEQILGDDPAYRLAKRIMNPR